MAATFYWLALTAALVLLNASLTFENVWPTPKIHLSHAVSVELAVCVLLLVTVHRWARRLSRQALPAIWVLLIAGRYLDVTAPGLYGRPFNAYWDSQHLGAVAAMFAAAAPVWLITVIAAGAALTLAAAFALARVALLRVADAVERRRPRRVLGALAWILVLLFAIGQLPGSFSSGIAFADPVTPAYVRQGRFVLAIAAAGAAAPAAGPAPSLDVDLPGLAGADVLLIFAESYGAVTYETPAIAAGVAGSRARFGTAIRETGRRVVSGYVDSPTFGGSSWLAHLSLLSGVEVRDQYVYTAVMSSQRPTLVTTFAREGYRTVALMPGMRQAWPEGAFYGFDVIYGHDRLSYEGPKFGWWAIPDQYALAKLDALERARSPRAPLFVVFPTSTTHAPFGPVPPYQSDWSRMLTSDPYPEGDVARSMAVTPDLMNLRPSYVRAMSYEYVSLAGYLRSHADDDFVMIVVGDHQPPAAVSGRDAPWQVPVHVIARRGPVLDRLRERGFLPGLQPQRPSLGGMHLLVPALLDAFGADAASALLRHTERQP